MNEMDEIDYLRGRIDRLSDELLTVKNKLKEAVIAGYPIKVGTRMIGRQGKTGEVVRIVAEEDWHGGWEAYAVIALHRKDGSLGKLEVSTWRAGQWKPASVVEPGDAA